LRRAEEDELAPSVAGRPGPAHFRFLFERVSPLHTGEIIGPGPDHVAVAELPTAGVDLIGAINQDLGKSFRICVTHADVETVFTRIDVAGPAG